MTTIPETTPARALPREHPAQQGIPSDLPFLTAQTAPARDVQILRQDSETKPIPTTPNQPPEGWCDPEDKPHRQPAPSTRPRRRAAARPVKPS